MKFCEIEAHVLFQNVPFSMKIGEIEAHFLFENEQFPTKICETPDTDMPLATILSLQSLAEITPESSRLAWGPSEARSRQYRPWHIYVLIRDATMSGTNRPFKKPFENHLKSI